MTDPHAGEPAQRPGFVPYSGPAQDQYRQRLSKPAQIALVAGATTVAFLVVAAVVVAIGITASAVTRESASSVASPVRSTITMPTVPTAPAVPSVVTVRNNSALGKVLKTPVCRLPGWSTDLAGMQAFTDVANGCFGQVWGATMPRIVLFDAADDSAPRSAGCPQNDPTKGFWICSGASASNYRSMVASAGAQLGSGLEWLARVAVTRVTVDSGQSADLRALVTTSGGDSSPRGREYMRRHAAQRACLTGTTLGMLVDNGISRADLDLAAGETALWNRLDDDATVTLDGAALTRWFHRGAGSRTTVPCGDAWSVPIAEIP